MQRWLLLSKCAATFHNKIDATCTVGLIKFIALYTPVGSPMRQLQINAQHKLSPLFLNKSACNHSQNNWPAQTNSRAICSFTTRSYFWSIIKKLRLTKCSAAPRCFQHCYSSGVFMSLCACYIFDPLHVTSHLSVYMFEIKGAMVCGRLFSILLTELSRLC